MTKNYLIYPCKTMRITQDYKGTTSHLPYSSGTPCDFPIDEGCSDTGRDYIYCPCDKMKVRRIYGTGEKATNALWLESMSKVYFADGTQNFFTMLIIHPDDDDLNKIRKGQIFRRKEKICREGKDGATAYHFHISAGKGRMKNKGWIKNSMGKYVLTTSVKTDKPENLFYIDSSFTKIKDSKELLFKPLPALYTKGKYTVTADRLNVRKGAGTSYEKVPYEKFTSATKRGIASLVGDGYDEDFFVKGLTLTISKAVGRWGKCSSGWICLDYCKKERDKK